MLSYLVIVLVIKISTLTLKIRDCCLYITDISRVSLSFVQ